MTQITDSCYVVLEPEFGRIVDEHGNRKAIRFKAKRLTRGRPQTGSNETAVRLNLKVDSSLFESLIPIVEIELGERDMFVNVAVEVTAVPEPDDSENDLPS